MKNINKILLTVIGFISFTVLVYATVTVASTSKSSYLPWQGTPGSFYDSAHNVGTGGAAEARFTDNGDGTVSDSVTGIMWQAVVSTTEQNDCRAYDTESYVNDEFYVGDSASSCNNATSGDCNWCASIRYCENLTLGGYTDWKLPSLKEGNSIVDYSRNNPAINTSFFTNLPHSSGYGNYWTTTTKWNGISYAWNIGGQLGTVLTNSKQSGTTSFAARCIRY